MVGRESGGGKVKKGKSRRGDHDDYQRLGKLMLNNPLIPADMDEDIDDDLAFDSDDEALYGHFFSNAAKPESSSSTTDKKKKGSEGRRGDDDDDLRDEQFSAIGKSEKRKKKRGRDDDSDDENLYNYREEGQNSDDDDGDDYVDLSDMFDMTVKEQQANAPKTTKKKKSAAAKAAPAHDVADDAGYDVGAAATRVAKKRRGAKVTEESESIYGMSAPGVDGSASSFSSAIRTFVKGKGSSENSGEDAVKHRLQEALLNKHNLLSMDADDPTKERVVRKQVRAVVEENLTKYKPLLRELNTAKHVHFPMKAPDSVPTPTTIGGIVAAAEARFSGESGGSRAGPGCAATTSAGKLASRMNDLLSRAGLARKPAGQQAAPGEQGTGSGEAAIGDYVQFDEDGQEGPDSDGEGPTHSYMAKLKSMLAFETSRRKRFNRIKSKTYRRILRKEKDRDRERRDKAFELLHPELARKRLAEKLLKARAEERVTQKHKNTSAWVKHAKRFADFDVNAKDAINEQLSIHQRLMQKMEQEAGEENYERYLAGEGDADSAMSSEEDRAVDELIASTAAGAKAAGAPSVPATSVLWKSVDAGGQGQGEGEDAGAGAHGKRTAAMRKARAELGGMKFMKAAREREEKDYEEQMGALQADIRRYQSGEDIEISSADEDTDTDGRAIKSKKTALSVRPTSAVPGRMKFGASAEAGATATIEAIRLKKQSGLRAAQSDSSDNEEEEDSGSDELSLASIGSDSEEEGGDEGKKASKPRAKVSVTPAARRAAKSAPKGQAPSAGVFAGLRQSSEDSKAGKKSASSSTRIVVRPSSAGLGAVDEGFAAGDAANEEAPGDDLRLHQEYLISRAFAHDDVDEEFLKDKEAQVEAIMRPEDRNGNLPGWGEWGGENPELNRRHQEKLSHTQMQKQIERSFLMKSRADAALDHVIINHDGVELVPDRMTLHMVPRPFSNPQEFARSMRQPLGPEWSSAVGFKEGVQPRVEVQQGHSVLPLDISLRGKKRTTTKRRKTDVSR